MLNAQVAGVDRTKPRLLVLGGCALFAVSLFLPVMRWDANAAHATAGSARVFLGSGFTLADGGFGGAGLLAVAVAAVVVLALATLAAGVNPQAWRVQVGAAAVALYYPAWVFYVFVKKWEDDVRPAEGVAVLIAAFACIGAGLVLSRPSR
jgi:hypothetical protein